MTGRELIKWILDNKAENDQFEVQYRDTEGEYYDTDKTLYLIKENATDENGWQYMRVVM